MFSRMQERATISEINSIQETNIVNENVLEDNEPTIYGAPTISADVDLVPVISDVSDNNYMLQYIENNYENKQLNRQFLFANYPYQYDPEFWYNFLQNNISLTTDYRYIELSMIRRVIEINHNPMDKWFGITNTRLQNIFNIEKDFVVQYYALGIIGIILVFAPYFIIIGVFAYDTIKKKFKNLTVQNLLAGITIVFLFGISYMSGNLLNSLSFIIYFALPFVILQKR